MSAASSSDPLLGSQEPIQQFMLPKRGNWHWYSAILVLLVVVIYLIYQADHQDFVPDYFFGKQSKAYNFAYLGTLLFLLFLAFFLGEILFRLLLLVEETRNLESRYKGKFRVVLKRTFNKWLLIPSFICLTVLFFLVMFSYFYQKQAFIQCWENNHNIFLLVIIFSSIIEAAVGLRNPSKVEELYNKDRASTDAAHGLAWSQYYGFCEKVCSPETFPDGRTSDLVDRMAEQEHILRENGKIPSDVIMVKKIIVLMPESCTIPNSIQDDNITKLAQEGDKVIFKKTEGEGRDYSQYIYLVKPKPVDMESANESMPTFSCMVVFANNLRTLREMSEGSEAGLSADERDDQMRAYVACLQDIIKKKKNMDSKIILLPYKDIDCNDKPVEIGRVLWNELNRQHKENDLC